MVSPVNNESDAAFSELSGPWDEKVEVSVKLYFRDTKLVVDGP